jgi:hypothetical protein
VQSFVVCIYRTHGSKQAHIDLHKKTKQHSVRRNASQWRHLHELKSEPPAAQYQRWHTVVFPHAQMRVDVLNGWGGADVGAGASGQVRCISYKLVFVSTQNE